MGEDSLPTRHGGGGTDQTVKWARAEDESFSPSSLRSSNPKFGAAALKIRALHSPVQHIDRTRFGELNAGIAASNQTMSISRALDYLI